MILINYDDIDKAAEEFAEGMFPTDFHDNYVDAFKVGATWLREQINKANEKTYKTQEERRAAFEERAKIGKAMNDECKDCCIDLTDWVKRECISIEAALACAWSNGCHYGVQHPELKELKAFEK